MNDEDRNMVVAADGTNPDDLADSAKAAGVSAEGARERPARTPVVGATAADAAMGKSARTRAPRRRAGIWDPTTRSVPALQRLTDQEAVRDHTLLPLRYARMASSPWAYLRGAAAGMAADLAAAPHSGLTVQMCGDAHILNFGLWASPERQLLFDARDFDETLPGPFEWDVKRLATSIFVLGDSVGLAESVADAAVDGMVNAYASAMKRYAHTGELDIWYDRITSEMNISQLKSAEADRFNSYIERVGRKRSQEGSTRKLTALVDGRRRITEDPPRRMHFTNRDEEDIYEQVFGTYLASIPPHLTRLVGRFRRLDTVRQVVGVGSVGMRVYLHLMEGDKARQQVFFQIKQASESVYEPFLEPSRFDNHGQRVVVGQQLMQSASDLFLGHVRVHEHDYYVRQFRDMKIIPSGEQIAGILPMFAAWCGTALAKSHARTGDPAAIDGYLGKGTAFREAVNRYGHAYAEQTHTDHAALVAAIAAGKVTAAQSPW